MTLTLRVLGWTLRACAAICITWIVVGVCRGAQGLTTIAGIASSVGFHAAFALAGTQLLGLAQRRADRPAEAPQVS